ncbi:hypothetical protein vBPpSSYP_44 [Pseudomonas phage vB_PpS_SYP]|nr:hypothetical protein vBPpSSYP_44 [Pseudomonas phage vB_PpS_SYP]
MIEMFGGIVVFMVLVAMIVGGLCGFTPSIRIKRYDLTLLSIVAFVTGCSGVNMLFFS